MKHIFSHHTISFKHAVEGIFWALKTQPNFRIHITFSILALLAGWYLSITRTEMLIILFTIVLGLVGEMVNTTIEAMTDLITKEWRQDAKIAKDVGAGMMLVTAVGAFAIALYIFIPYITRLITSPSV